ncbi:protein spinster isoform X2 [Coccinella septempunctata]|uniref:protein spinster isoform X2 n=1 Tax=Coccinella septempunctata TaxID=41139 RepID=UPI001D084BDA|nr:protein spinster isoform X2 [Coccinella septempunctata]
MPSEKIERSSNLMLKQFKTMDVDIPQNHSQAELLHSGGDNTRNTGESVEVEVKTFRDVTTREWIAIFILCFVNLINYMDRFTIAGILDQIQTYFNIQNDKGGLLQTVFVITYMIFAPIFGYLGDRYSRKLIMTAGVFLWSLTTLAGSFMTNYWWFLLFRGLVGIGEASYSTIAPTIISDLFSGDMRSKMLALFYFAIPVGSGLGYIVGSETAKLMNSWAWALRVTPVLGIVAVLLVYFVLKDPVRGESEGSGHLEATTFKEDIKDIVRNRSFMFSTAGFTCVAFVAGALAWWGPKFIQMGLELQQGGPVDKDSNSFIFGGITIAAGVVGLTMGGYLSQNLRVVYQKADPLICGVGLVVSAPLLLGCTYAATSNTALCYVLLFLGQVTLNLNWAIVGDILLYVVIPTRRSAAEGFQLLFSHALGDAGSPYLIGVLADAFNISMSGSSTLSSSNTTILRSSSNYNDFKSLQYALFSTCFVEVLGGFFFLITAFYIVEDKRKVEKAIHADQHTHQNEVMDYIETTTNQID